MEKKSQNHCETKCKQKDSHLNPQAIIASQSDQKLTNPEVQTTDYTQNI